MSFMFPEHDFHALSLEDLFEARDIFHVQLAGKTNVIATALGRYLIRSSDPWPKGRQNTEEIRARRTKKKKRTLANSEIRPYSWPCILVFVEQWQDPADFGKGHLDHDDMLPRSVALPNGKRVPVCVVEATPEAVPPPQPINPVLPAHQIGGGYPLIANVQKQEQVASVGCLVTDGHRTYALTARHVTGDEGEIVLSRFAGAAKPVRVGSSSGKNLGRIPFGDIHPQWPGDHVYCNLDVGLLTLDDIHQWTPWIYRIGQMGRVVDIRNGSVLFRLLGCGVTAYGCAGRRMQGQVQGLFYRYKSLNGFDYVSDFLIGPMPGEELSTQPGDSGTVWLLNSDDQEGPPPLCVQWGGHVFQGAGGRSRSPYALATALSTVCDQLNVSVVRDWNLDRPEFWGEMGHYVIGAKACEMVTTPKLAKLMMANQNRIGFKDGPMSDPDKFRIHSAHYPFVPLADVADDVWRTTRIGGNNHPDINNDGNNHFADMDEKATSGQYQGKTLMDLFNANHNSVDPDVWLEFYASLGGSTKPGALPFRVWQSFKVMVDALNDPHGPDVLTYVCAAGCMAHYVGDACQPLHVSRLHHGFPPLHSGTVPYEVHSVYETDMLNEHAGDVVQGLKARIATWNHQLQASIPNGRGAAIRVVELMKKTITTIPPEKLVTAYNEEHSPGARLNRLWSDYGEKTMDCMFEGCRCMAEIWQSAWALGPTSLAQLPASKLVGLDRPQLSTLYRKSTFLPSVSLDNMKPLL